MILLFQHSFAFTRSGSNNLSTLNGEYLVKMAAENISLTDVVNAANVIKPFIHRTPVVTCNFFDNITGKNIFFKCENFQKIGAFKIRGTTNAIHNILEANDSDGKPIMVTHSSGNHAQAVASASKLNGLKAWIVMPSNAPQVKKNAVKGYGAEIVECEPTQECREATAKKLMQELGKDAVFLSPYDDVNIIAGQGTIGLEILEDVPDLDAIVVPVGGGGMLSGICVAVKGMNPKVKILAAEPVNADDCAQSFAVGRKVPNKSPPQTVADGLKVNVGDITWPIIRDSISDVITVTEDEIVSAMKLVFERMKLVIEPSAAVGVAAILTNRFEADYSTLNKVCVVLCGGNVDMEKLPWLK